ncbi:MAG: CoA pyrophosphatase [Pseudomonadota bacterium]
MAIDSSFDAAALRRAFAGTVVPSDPTDVIDLPGSEHWPADLRAKLEGLLKPAGVLVPFIQRAEGLTVLLTERSAELKHHAGQVSFPGGGMEPHDTDIGETALRETEEEVGIAREAVELVGFLEPMPTVTGYAVTPAIGLIAEPPALALDGQEVASAFEVPFDYLLDRDNGKMIERELFGRQTTMLEYHYDGYRIWGATAMMIIQLLKIISK